MIDGARVLVLGGTRFIGRHLVEALLSVGCDVTCAHRGHQDPFGTAVRHVHFDRNDHAEVQAALDGERYDIVYEHSYVHPKGTRAEDVEAVLDAVGGAARRYVFTSSFAVYPVGAEVDEESPYAARDDPFCRDKVASERLLKERARLEGLPLTTVRPAFVFGPHNRGYQEAFFWDRLAMGRQIVLPDDGSTPMQFAYVEDVARLLCLVADHPAAVGEAFNVAYPVTTQRGWVEALARAAGVEARMAAVPRETIFALGGSPFDAPHYYGETLDVAGVLGEFSARAEKAQRLLGFETTPLAVALRRTRAWYETQRQAGAPVQDFSFEDRLIAAASCR